MGVGGRWLLLLFGEEFVAGYPALFALIVGQAVNSLAGSVAYLLIMTGHQNRAAAIMGAGVMVIVLLCFALVPALGALGAALATATGMLVWNGGMYVWARRRLGLDPTLLGVGRKAKQIDPSNNV
jgi:O-antigen/teichoic acid export membrane protein